MFDSLKKSKTLRSLLAAGALFGAGALGAQSAEQDKPSAKEEVQTKVDDPLAARLNLQTGYQILAEALEENLCYCYDDKGVPACGSGVHFKDFRDLKDVEVLKITFKKGHVVNLEDKAYLQKIADSIFRDRLSVRRFDGILTARKVKLKDALNPNSHLPKGKQRRWKRPSLVLIPSATLEGINRLAAETKVEAALKVHPNLLDLPFLAQLIPVDLIYTRGESGYRKEFGEFQKAVIDGDLSKMAEQCSIREDFRRTAIKQALLAIAGVMRDNPHVPQDVCLGFFHNFVKVKHRTLLEKNQRDKKIEAGDAIDSPLVPARERRLFQGLDQVVQMGWQFEQGLTRNGVDVYRLKKYRDQRIQK